MLILWPYSMELITIIALAAGLSFDTFAVSLSCGLAKTSIKFIEAVRVGIVMALFQAGFTVGGYYLGSLVTDSFKAIDHWIALGLLSFLGGKMIYEGITAKNTESHYDITSWSSLILMGTGTSIDAFAVGISMALLEIAILLPSIIIGSITFLASMTAIRLGKGLGKKFGNLVEVIGGVILVSIGIRIFIEHVLLNSA